MPSLFLWRSQLILFWTLVVLVYWCYGTQLSVFASTTADFFGTKNFGMNYGILFTAWGAAGILGPEIAGRVYRTFGDYRYAFFATSALAFVALAALAMARAPVKQRQGATV
jgi:OFA family oxalate/formate antiporter-like MFS transporter